MAQEKSFLEKLSIIAQIIISICAMYLSYKIGDNQNQISKLNYSPVFIFQKSLEYDDNLHIYHTERLSITNEGYPIQNFDKNIKTYILVKKTTNQTSNEILVPISYYWVSYTANGGKGKLSELSGKNNNSHAFNLSQQVVELNNKNKDEIVSIDIITTATLKYTEADESTKELYYINERLTTKDEVAALENKKINRLPLNIENLKLETLLNLMQ
ncbi:hypothetical protein GHT46_07420 [Citrobacter freundii]|uniref:hypothetical protein n=1 Tax=Citrobacter freundii complex TaxID=1344959 RepID=UPI0008FD1C1D|nr:MULTISPECIES: hypothetical protein [Citrobacter freundii complex]MBJ9064560.1 hypothetical protein [Citrobacter freundii]MBJ9348829.1 hypothetical protein [Citrobacter freundii]MDQ2471324.1 hypothetical protein [Citrobacter freundii]OIY08164.1 hypothetical protein BED44_04770 [Citrobacter freundii]HED3297731.1 hypothetical protein [Citrobacter freundii]